jgi:hypothetical protein
MTRFHPASMHGSVQHDLCLALKCVLVLAFAVLSMVTMGLPGSLMLAGAWLLAAGLARTVTGLAGPVSWAGAIVVEITLVVGLSGVVAHLSHSPQPAFISLAILAAPSLLGLGALLFAWLRRQGVRVTRGAAHPFPALMVQCGGLAVAAWIATRGPNYGYAWAMSGDARNHVLIVREILSQGGLTPGELKIYPAVVDAVIALISGAGGRAGLAPGQLMLHDVQAIATTYILAALAMASLSVAALLELRPREMAESRRLTVPAMLVLAASAAVAASPLVLGTALVGGFVDAYGTLPLVLAAIVLAIRCCAGPSPIVFSLLGAATGLILFAFPILVVVPVALVALTTVVIALVYNHREAIAVGAYRSWAWVGAGCVSWGAVAVTAGVFVTQETTLRAAFVLPGAITPPQPATLWLVGLVTIAVLLQSRDPRGRLQMLVPLAVAVAGQATLQWLTHLTGTGSVWTYYASKSLWMLVSCLIWVAFVPLMQVAEVRYAGVRAAVRDTMLASAQIGALSMAIFIVVGFSTTIGDPLGAAAAGWSQPTVSVVSETAALANHYQRFVLWEWSDPSDDRLGNFWAAAVWGTTSSGGLVSYPGLPGGVDAWAYMETESGSDELCEAVRSIPGLVVVTTNPTLAARSTAVCTGIPIDVRVVPNG